MKIAVCKRRLRWPARSGDDLHTTEVARALARRGHDVTMLVAALDDSQPPGVQCITLAPGSGDVSPRGYMQRRFAHYWGIDDRIVSGFRQHFQEHAYDACIAAGFDGPFFLAEFRKAARIWYAADELLHQHLSSLPHQPNLIAKGNALRAGLQQAVYERAFRNVCQRVWVVTEDEKQWMRRAGGYRKVDVLPNGVDVEAFTPARVAPKPHRMCFWGRLDFPPNFQALEWFVQRVWPGLRKAVPDAELQVMGFAPTAAVKQWCDQPGIRLLEDVPDLRPEICTAAVAIFPFVSGGGIKNKLLEGAALARALVVTPLACNGLQHPENSGLIICRSAEDWIGELQRLFANPSAAQIAGEKARAWVTEHHTWDKTAELAEKSLLAASEL